MSAQRLPFDAPRVQLAVGVALALLMTCTRGQHFATVEALPSASWAVFFLAGALLRTAWAYPLLFALAAALDYGSYAIGTISDWCLSPAYWVLLPAYGTLWLGGRLYARGHRGGWRDVPRLALALVVIAFVTYLISGGGYYALSGHYVPTLAGFLPRIAHYYPRALGTMAGYVGVALLPVWALRLVPAWHAAGHGRAKA
jgi:hypothetical protein